MVSVIILAGGTGTRMKTHGMPKQFLSLYGKPIICYTIEAFERCHLVDRIIIPCNAEWVRHLNRLIVEYNFDKVYRVVEGGEDRQESVRRGLEMLESVGDDDITLIHDAVRPLVAQETILENIRVAREFGDAMTVKPCVETVVFTKTDEADFSDFADRNSTYTLSSPQTFKTKTLLSIYEQIDKAGPGEMPLLDASLLYSHLGHPVHLVKDTGTNIKVTTPQDFYYLRSYLEMQENKDIFGI